MADNDGNLELTVIHATERDEPKDRERIAWKLVKNLPVTSKADAIEKLEWYALRWKIELFHKVLKSGCRAEDSELPTAERVMGGMHAASRQRQIAARPQTGILNKESALHGVHR